MNLRSVIFLLTDKCNYNCNYCYQWNAHGKDIDPLKAKQAVKYILNNSSSKLNITFSGGEPLLKFNLIEKCLFFIKKNSEGGKKKINFSIITNGSLIDNKILHFLNEHYFDVQFSYDVYIKDDETQYDKKLQGKNVLKQLINAENISLSTNTVFTPEKSDKIFSSVEFLNSKGVKNIGIGIDQTSLWDKRSLTIFRNELERTKDLVISEYQKTGQIIVDYFSTDEPSGIKTCAASGEQITITPNGELWGCSAFYYYDWENSIEDKNDYCYGKIEDLESEEFEKRVEKVRSNHRKFKTDNFKTENTKCFLCEYLQECLICPAQKYSFIKGKRSIFEIPDHTCEMNKIIFKLNREFRSEVKQINTY